MTLSLVSPVEEATVQKLKDVVVPKRFFKRIDLGVPILNEMFGGTDMPGILPGTSILFTGDPGAGKSTFGLQLADLLAKQGKNVLYNACEESKYIVKLRANRLRLHGGFDLAFIPQVDSLLEYCSKNGVEILMQDSLQTLQDGTTEGNKKIINAVEKIQASSKEIDLTPILIGHVTKGGIFQGPNKVKHDVDAHAHLAIRQDGTRVFQFEKNRFGPAYLPYEFQVNAQGVDFRQATTQEPTAGSNGMSEGRAAERRANITTMIKSKLLQGEKISGYCFERFNVTCSGGFWRAMIERAVKELESEGHIIGEVRDGPGGSGRAHVFVTVKAKQDKKES